MRQPDGKVVAVGTDEGHGSVAFALARYNANGSLDTSFAGDGKQTTENFGTPTGVALQGDGKIVVVGTDGADFALARYNPNGSLDTSFSGDGRQTTDFGGPGGDGATGVAIQAGKIVAVGYGGTQRDFVVARYNPNGSLDTSFSGSAARGRPTSGATDVARGVAIQGDGKIVAVGRAGGADFRFGLARYNPNGSLDMSFSGGGKQTTDFGAGDDEAQGVALQGDGKIVVVGVGWRRRLRARPLQPERLAGHELLRRRQAEDRLRGRRRGKRRDASGTARSSRSAAVAPAATSRLPATTRTARSTRASRAMASRRPTSGATMTRRAGVALQRRQGRRGRLRRLHLLHRRQQVRARPLQPQRLARHELLRRRQADDRLRGLAVTVQPGWRSRATARSSRSATPALPASATSRSPATTRTARSTRASRGDGRQTTDFGDSDGASGVALQADGKIVVVGFSCNGTDSDVRARPLQPQRLARHHLLRRRQADDQLRGLRRPGDRAWRSRATARSSRWAAGRATATSRSPATTRTARSTRASPATASRRPTSRAFGDAATGVALQGDGKIVVGRLTVRDGRLRARPLQPERLARHELLGRRQADDRLRWASTVANGVALQGDGKIVAVGCGRGHGGNDFALARYNPNGIAGHELLRRRQADDGLRCAPRRPARSRSRATARSSRLAAPSPPPDDFALARYNAERLARHELLRRRQADDRLRGLQRGERGGAPGRWQDRRGRLRPGPHPIRRFRASPLSG